jgi:hypothetical protein
MDAVTNVVGVLMIVFVLVALKVASTVEKFLSELPPATPEMVENLEKQLEALPLPPKTPEQIEKETEMAKLEIKKITAELSTIDLTSVQQSVKFMDLDELQKKMEDATKQRDNAKEELDKLFAEVDRLKKALDDTPVYAPPPPKFVRIPNPRPVPENAVKENFFIAKGRVVYLNEAQFISSVLAEFEKNRRAFLSPKSTPDKPLYDPAKVIEHFSRARIGDRSMAATVEQTSPTSNALFMKLVVQEGAGESVEQLKNPASTFQRGLRKFKSEPGKVVSLIVAADSVETYLEARLVADTIGTPVLWNLTSLEYHRVRLPGIVLDVPPAAPTPPKPPGQGIKPPTEQID